MITKDVMLKKFFTYLIICFLKITPRIVKLRVSQETALFKECVGG